jgi:hypothetical protein
VSDPQLARLERQVRHAPADAGSLVRLGLAYERSRRLREAYLAFERAHTLNPDDPTVTEHWERLGGGSEGKFLAALGGAWRSADRVHAATMLGVCGQHLAAGVLVEALQSDRHFAVRQAAASALGILGDTRASGDLVRGLDDENRWVRCACVVALHRLHADPAGLAVFSARPDWLDPRVADWRAWWAERGA